MARYSYSKLETYATCPLQYKYRYIDRVRMDLGPTIESFLGSRVHDTLEWLYRLVHNGALPTLSQVRERYHFLWEAEWTDDVRVIRPEVTPEGLRRVGERCLELYYNRHAPFDEGIVLGLEDPFAIRLDDDVVLNGYLDRLTRQDGDVYEVHDYKTSARLPTPEEAEQDQQAGWYALAVRERFRHASEIRLVWHYLRFDERLVTTRSPEQTERLKEDIRRRIKEVELARSFPPQESALCDWCEYFTICPAKGHRLAVESIPDNTYLGEPGVALVNRLAALKDELKEFTQRKEREIAQVEEALHEYAHQHGYSVVVGSDMEAVVEDQEKVQFPKADHPDRTELEESVRAAGLWDELSNLDLAKLRRALADGRLPDRLRAEVERLGTQQTKPHIRLRKRRT